MNTDQLLISSLARAALKQDHNAVAAILNDCPDDKLRDATGHTLTLLVAGFKATFCPRDWHAFVNEATASLTLMELDPS